MANDKDDRIDRWMAADLANGGDPDTYWSRRSATITSGAEVEEVPSVLETLLRLRHRAEAAEYAGKRLLPLAEFFDAKARWSEATFGPGDRYDRVLKHIRKELKEISRKPDDLEEWVDLVFLAMDGAWRSAKATGESFAAMILAKHAKNLARKWPDWRTLKPGQVAEHVRGADEAPKGTGAADLADRIWALIEEFEQQHPFKSTPGFDDNGSNDRALLFNLISQAFGAKQQRVIDAAHRVVDLVDELEGASPDELKDRYPQLYELAMVDLNHALIVIEGRDSGEEE